MACPGCIGQTKVICILNYPNKLFTCCVLFGFPIFQYEGMVYIFFRRTLALRNILQALAEIEYNGYFLLICAMVYSVGGRSGYMYIGFYNKRISDWTRRWDRLTIVGAGTIKTCLLGEVRPFSNNDSVLLWTNLFDMKVNHHSVILYQKLLWITCQGMANKIRV